MNDEDFHAFRTNPDIDLVSPTDIMLVCTVYCWLCVISCQCRSGCLEQSLLGDGSHRLLSAAQAAKMAVVYSQYTSLYVLTNVVSCSINRSLPQLTVASNWHKSGFFQNKTLCQDKTEITTPPVCFAMESVTYFDTEEKPKNVTILRKVLELKEAAFLYDF